MKTEETDEMKKVLRSGLRMFCDLASRTCGNVEGTPCDDSNPNYICKYHRWIKDARRVLRQEET